MPTYLTPGVYVEEIPAQSKPIEGVGTSIAAFVGLAPGRAGQHADADLELDPVRPHLRRPAEPRERAVHGGRLPRPRRLRLLPERRRPLLDRPRRQRRRRRGSAPGAGGAAGGGRTRRSRRSAPWRSTASRTTSSVEITRGGAEPPPEGEGEDGGGGGGKDGRSRPTAWWCTAGDAREEHEGLTLKKGRNYIATKVNAGVEADQARGDRRVAAGRAAGPRHRHVQAARRPSAEPRDLGASRLRGRRRQAPGHGRPRGGRRDHDGLRARPDDARVERRRRQRRATSRAR